MLVPTIDHFTATAPKDADQVQGCAKNLLKHECASEPLAEGQDNDWVSRADTVREHT